MALVKFEAPKVQDYCDLRVNAGMSLNRLKRLKRGYPMLALTSQFMSKKL